MKLVTVAKAEDVEGIEVLFEKNEHGNVTRLIVLKQFPALGTAFIVETDAYSSLRVRKPAPLVKKASYTVKGAVAGLPVWERFDTAAEAEARQKEIWNVAPDSNVTIHVGEDLVVDEG